MSVMKLYAHRQTSTQRKTALYWTKKVQIFFQNGQSSASTENSVSVRPPTSHTVTVSTACLVH